MLGASASPASATTDYGLDMNEVCHYEVASSSYALLVSPGYIPDWRCQSGYNQFGLDLALWCAYDYGSTAVAIYYNYYDPYSWRCRV